ncbi:MAG: UDP-N-acetylmuramoyl-tripeptide--D-alanyl-D-alanine ligase [Mogibacterium sp.]|nr:UDP-N-acetylmuramoyl-tripeptide--D-alanyl-D-alanine ligase [Mogibacterium sp.]
MKKTSLEYIVRGTKGTLYAEAAGEAYRAVSAVSIDSRTVPEDCLFFCIIGERVDAHTFLNDVREKGCHNVVVSDPAWAERMRQAGDMNVVLVPDTTRAMMDLAEQYMNDWPELIKVAVTGSVGKTTTKELIYSVIASRYRAGKTRGNLNSEFGVPLTVFSFDPEIEAAVIEMGAGGTGPIRELSQIVKPDVAVITTVGTSHMEFFGSRDGLATEKISITEGMTDGVLIVNADCDMLTEEQVRRRVGDEVELRLVGTGGTEDYVVSGISDRGIDGVSCTVESCAEGDLRRVTFDLPVIGAHNALNAALALAAGEAVGVPMEDGVKALAGIEQNANRLEILEKDGVRVINDTYNASPESMRAGLRVLANSPADRRVAILGSMFELGDTAAELHASVGQAVADLGIDVLLTVGMEGTYIAEGAARAMIEKGGRGLEIQSFMDKQEAAAVAKSLVKAGDVVLIKASRSMGLEYISHSLTDR